MARSMAASDEVLPLRENEGRAGYHARPATSASDNHIDLRHQRSMRFRKFGTMLEPSASVPNPRTQRAATNTLPSRPTPAEVSAVCNWTSTASHGAERQPTLPQTPKHNLAPQTPPPPLALLYPRWDHLANSTTALHDQQKRNRALPQLTATAPSSPGRYLNPSPIPLTPSTVCSFDSLYADGRGAWSSSPASAQFRHLPNTPESMPVDNFSRPKRSSVRYQESPRRRATDGPLPPAYPASDSQDYLGPRGRNLSFSSNVTTASSSSLPIRTTSRQGSTHGTAPQPLTRPTIMYGRNQSTPPLNREPLPSTPTDNTRPVVRSQLSAASIPQEATNGERNVIAARWNSHVSIYGPVDEGLSVDDVMGMYEKGFRDSTSAPSTSQVYQPEHEQDGRDGEDEQSPTSRSELSRRRSAVLEAMTDSLPIPNLCKKTVTPLPTVPDTAAPLIRFTESPTRETSDTTPGSPSSPIQRDSFAFFQTKHTLSGSSSDASDHAKPETKRDSGKHVDDDDVPSKPRRQASDMSSKIDFSVEPSDPTRDRYGFKKENQYVSQKEFDMWNTGYTEYLARRRKKWCVYMKETGLMTDNPNRFPSHCAKTKRFVRKGIPPEWRGAAWFYYAGGPAIIQKHRGVYEDLLNQQAKDVDNEAIERDLHRTFPDNIKFKASKPGPLNGPSKDLDHPAAEAQSKEAPADETHIISSLRRVLHAFSIYNPRIGYCQSLNFLAGLLLLFVESEEHAFWLLNIITRVYLPGTHEVSLEGANVDLGVLMSALHDCMPAVWAKIGGELDGTDAKPKSRRHRRGADPARLPPITLCMTAWFMSCFIGTLPIESTLRVWDVFFYEGSKTLFRIALTVFKLGESEVKTVGDPMEIFQVVQTIPRRLIDANALLEACFKRRNGIGHLSQETIEQKRRERREGNKLERERTAAGLTEDVDVKRKNTIFGTRRKAKLRLNDVL